MRNVLENEIFLVFFLYLSLLGFLSVRSSNAQTYFLFVSLHLCLGSCWFCLLEFFHESRICFFGANFSACVGASSAFWFVPFCCSSRENAEKSNLRVFINSLAFLVFPQFPRNLSLFLTSFSGPETWFLILLRNNRRAVAFSALLLLLLELNTELPGDICTCLRFLWWGGLRTEIVWLRSRLSQRCERNFQRFAFELALWCEKDIRPF